MWDWAIYGALIVGFLAGTGAIVYLVVRILDALRAFKRLRRGIARGLSKLADLGEQTADKVGTATDTAELETSLSRLRVDLARAAVLQQAMDEVGDTVKRFTAFYPRK